MPRPRPSRSGAASHATCSRSAFCEKTGGSSASAGARRQRERRHSGRARRPRAAGRPAAASRSAVHCPLSDVHRLVALEAEVGVLAVVRQLAAEARQRREAVGEDPADGLLGVRRVAAHDHAHVAGERHRLAVHRQLLAVERVVGARRRRAATASALPRPRSQTARSFGSSRTSASVRISGCVAVAAPALDERPVGRLLRRRRLGRQHRQDLRLAEDLADRRRRLARVEQAEEVERRVDVERERHAPRPSTVKAAWAASQPHGRAHRRAAPSARRPARRARTARPPASAASVPVDLVPAAARRAHLRRRTRAGPRLPAARRDRRRTGPGPASRPPPSPCGRRRTTPAGRGTRGRSAPPTGGSRRRRARGAACGRASASCRSRPPRSRRCGASGTR